MDHGEPDHKGDVISFEILASGCTLGEAIRKLRQLASLPENGARRLPVNARSQPREYQNSASLQPMTLDFLERGNHDDVKRLAELRCIAREAVEICGCRWCIWFATLWNSRAWIVTDRMRYVAEARRLDGQLWEHLDGKPKVWTQPGSRKSWPLGIFEANEKGKTLILVEGSADYVAAYHWIWAEARSDVSPIGMLGAGPSIHPVALPLFAKKRVRIFPHYDAAAQWL